MNVADFADKPDYQRQIQRKLGLPISAAVPAPHVESHPQVRNSRAVPAQAAHPRGRVIVRLTGRRHNLCDPDGQSGKAVLDGLVAAGVLRGDSAKQIAWVETLQEKIDRDVPEETVVEIFEEIAG